MIEMNSVIHKIQGWKIGMSTMRYITVTRYRLIIVTPSLSTEARLRIPGTLTEVSLEIRQIIVKSRLTDGCQY